MKVQKAHAAIIAIVLLSFALSALFYPALPARVPSHWNAAGQVDGYMQKGLAAVFMPLIIIALAALFLVIPRIDPMKANIEKFRKHYDRFIIIMCAFMLAVHLFTLLWGIGIRVNPNAAVSLGIGVLFYYAGVLCENAKRNWFIGIRTPWTLSSDSVWEKTNRRGGKLFKVAAIIALMGALFPAYAVLLIIVPVLAFTAYTVAFSYLEYGKEARDAGIPVRGEAHAGKPAAKAKKRAGKKRRNTRRKKKGKGR